MSTMKTPRGWTAFWSATLLNRLAIMEYLASRSARLDHTVKSGQSALWVASQLRVPRTEWTSWSGAARGSTWPAGTTARLPSHEASRSDENLEIVRILVERGGASLTRRSNDGKRAIDHARSSGAKRITEYLSAKMLAK